MKRFEKALVDFEAALEIDPNRSDNYYGRAQTFFDMNELELAKNDCNRALEISPGHQSAKELLAAINKV